MKRITAVLCCLLLTVLAAAAAAEALETLDPASARKVSAGDLGLGKKTTLPVFGAPMENAWRGSKGKAAVSVSEPFLVLGAAQKGQWLLVDYDVNKSSRRVGWIRRPEAYEADESLNLPLDRRLCRVKADCVLTDDPGKSRREIRTLRSGETVIAMLGMKGEKKNWLYVEADVNGQPVWGFADAGCLEEENPWSLEGDRLIVREGISRMGSVWGMDEEGYGSPVIQKGDIWCPGLNLRDMLSAPVHEIVLPSTLRMIGDEALTELTGQSVFLAGPADWVSDMAFAYGWISSLILGKDYTGGMPGLYGLVIQAWEVEAGNRQYASRDGVLFSADGETLLSYPPGRTALHYDVPAGTKTIASYAFDDGDMGIPLQTISLPIGLKRIEAYAFGGCGRLHSLTVPLTVTELDDDAFANCVSLERLSLPPGMTASWDDDYALHEDQSRYMGDNGGTLETPRATDNFGRVITETRVTVSVWLSGENGEGPVPVYISPTAETPVKEKPSGTRASYSSFAGNRAKIWDWGDDSWVSLDHTLPAGNSVFFEISAVLPTEEGMAELKRRNMDAYYAAYFDDEDDMVGRFYQESGKAGTEDDETELPLSQLILRRPFTGDSRVFAMLMTDKPGQPIHLLDAPGGASLGWTYRSEQAEVLETREDWARIRTIALTGWVKTENLLIVEQESR
ncbi:MAG: leucine-rich repeat domain-containing protein [Clostridia bacterium]|nr:leucine-rich repeat domain-containing protein [Clostridia bacterium]